MNLLRNSLFSLGSKAIEVVSSIVLLVILARLLDPEDFGVFAIILSVQSLLQPLSNIGLTEAYVKFRASSNELQNSFFTVSIALGLLNVFILLVLAPLASKEFGNEILQDAIYIFSISIIFTSISQQGIAKLTRDKRFDQLLLIFLLANLLTFLFSIYLALNQYGLWVLVAKPIILNALIAVMVFKFTGFNYKLSSWASIKLFKSHF